MTFFSLIKDIFLILGRIYTLGGIGRLKDATSDYNESYEKYAEFRTEIDTIAKDSRIRLAALGENIKRAFVQLDRVEKVFSTSIGHGRFDNESENSGLHSSTFDRLLRVNDRFSSVMGASSGAAGGTTVALGAWAAVGAFGTASTGTAIGTLSGVAATNATLAWFGGGALAAGGAGMAGGMVVLSGLVLLPVVLIWSWAVHRKAKKLEIETRKLVELLPQMPSHLRKMKEENEIVKQREGYLSSVCQSMEREVQIVMHALYPNRLLSKLRRRARKLFGGDFYFDSELKLIDDIMYKIDRFLSAIEADRRTKNASSRGLRGSF